MSLENFHYNESHLPKEIHQDFSLLLVPETRRLGVMKSLRRYFNNGIGYPVEKDNTIINTKYRLSKLQVYIIPQIPTRYPFYIVTPDHTDDFFIHKESFVNPEKVFLTVVHQAPNIRIERSIEFPLESQVPLIAQSQFSILGFPTTGFTKPEDILVPEHSALILPTDKIARPGTHASQIVESGIFFNCYGLRHSEFYSLWVKTGS